MFDIESLTNQTINQAGDTQRLQVPEGDWPFLCEEIKVEERQHAKMNDGKPFVELRYKGIIDSQEVRDALRRDKVTFQGNFILDTVTTDSGATILDMSPGQNATLNAWREAVGLNKDGLEFKLPMLVGTMPMITVRHKISDDGTVNANVRKFSKRS